MAYTLENRQVDGTPVHEKGDGAIDFHVFVDRPTWEAFAGHGSVYKIGGRRIAAPVGKISIGMDGGEGTVESMKGYKLKSIWPENADTLTYSRGK